MIVIGKLMVLWLICAYTFNCFLDCLLVAWWPCWAVCCMIGLFENKCQKEHSAMLTSSVMWCYILRHLLLYYIQYYIYSIQYLWHPLACELNTYSTQYDTGLNLQYFHTNTQKNQEKTTCLQDSMDNKTTWWGTKLAYIFQELPEGSLEMYWTSTCCSH